MQLEGKKISMKGFRNYKEEVAYNLGKKVKILLSPILSDNFF